MATAKKTTKKPARSATRSVAGGATKAPAKKAAAPKKAAAKPAAAPRPKSLRDSVAGGGKKAAPKTVATKAAPAKPSITAKKEAPAERYLYAVGRRKTAVAQVRLYPAKGEATVVVNERDPKAYFGTPALQANATAPLTALGLENDFRVSLLVRGGGLHGQSDAAKLAVARALLKHDELLRVTLRSHGFLTRDARSVERKKPGLKKARRSPQWSKR